MTRAWRPAPGARRASPAAAPAALAALGVALLLAAPGARAQEPGGRTPVDSTFAFEIHPSLPSYRFTIRHDPESGIPVRVEVRRGDAPDVIQTLEELTADEPPPGGVDDVAAQDVNFDGYADLKVLAMWGATGNRTYEWFLFDPDAGRFVRDPQLTDLVNPVPDPVGETIRAHSGGGMAGLVFQDGVYLWEGQVLVCVRLLRQDWDPARALFTRVTEERRGRELVPVRRGVHFDGEVRRGGSFSLPLTDTLKFELDSFPGGWEIAVRAARRSEENLARLTPPLHGPNPRQIVGWHFASARSGGAVAAGLNAPQREREFIFSEKVGRSIQGPQSTEPPTADDIEEIAGDGVGTLTIEDLRLAEPLPGEEPNIEWMRFAVTVDFP